MGGLYQRPDSKLLGASPAPCEGRGPPYWYSLSLPIVSSVIVGRDIFISPALQLLYELPVYLKHVITISQDVDPAKKKVFKNNERK